MASTPASRAYPTILLFGAPGAGKGTQGKLLGEKPGFLHLAMGDVFRAIDRGSDLGKRFLEYSTRGELVPDDLTIEIWRDYMKTKAAPKLQNGSLLILDGIPRSVAQAGAMKNDINVLLILHLVAHDEDEMVDRMRKRALSENRPDDADEQVIRRRFAVYHATTAPVLRCYDRSLVRDVDALGTRDEVQQRIMSAIAPLRTARA